MEKKVIKNVKPAPAKIPQVFDFSTPVKYIVLAIIAFVFYANSIPNKYAYDDSITIETNSYVQMGFKGIPKILGNDSYASFYSDLGADPTKQLSGGRFRPLSEIVFAIEQQLLGGSDMLPYFRHLVNVLAYMACILAIFYFLDKFLLRKIPSGSDIAFLSTLLFAIHPIHTEVVANIKSLDEILSLLFIMLTFIFGLKYLQISRQSSVVSSQLKYGTFILSLLSFLLAMLSKEYALTLIFFIPFLFYLLEGKTPLSAIKASIPYYGVFVVYLLLRYNAVGFHSNIMKNASVWTKPYLYATHIQQIATEWFVLGKYVVILLFPYPLSADYSYYQIKYHDLLDISVIASILIYLAMAVSGFLLMQKRNPVSFAVFFFLLNVLMISNFVMDIGATMGERLVFHSSLGFVIILSYYIFKAVSGMNIGTKRNILVGLSSVIVIACFGDTVIRNAQWKNNDSLFIHDANIVPRSFLVNGNASSAYLRFAQRKENTAEQSKEYRDSSKKYAFRALQYFPKDDMAYSNLGGIYFLEGNYDSAEYYWNTVEKINPFFQGLKANYNVLSKVFFAKGMDLGKQNKQPREGLRYMKKAVRYDSTNSTIWYNMGGAYFSIQQYDSAKYAWTKALHFKPDNADAKRGLQALAQGK